MKERKALYEDALHATRAAIAEGIVRGGGVALIQASRVLDKLVLEGDEQRCTCPGNVLEIPCRAIAENAGMDGTVVAASHIRRSKDKNYGYDADAGEYETSARPASWIR